MYGERSQVVKAPGCGPGIRGFKSHRSPFKQAQIDYRKIRGLKPRLHKSKVRSQKFLTPFRL